MTEIPYNHARAACRAVSILLLPAVLSACSATTSQLPDPVPSACLVVDDDARAQLTLGIAGARADAADARLRAERLLAAQVFEPLVRVDCNGQVIPALAAEWSSEDGRTWRFLLQPGVLFHDGVPVTARSVMAAWSAMHMPAFAAVSAVGEMELAVTLIAAADVRVFAAAAHAVKRSTTDGLVGTGAFRYEGEPDALRIAAFAVSAAPQSIRAQLFAGDPRAALDAGVDALVTGDPAVLAYARARSDYATVPLPWSRTYVLAATARNSGGRPSAAVLDALARDAVRGEARAAQGPFWWEQCGRADMPPRDEARTGDGRMIVYPEGDMIARGLAERIVALAWPAERMPAWLRDLLPADGSGPPYARGLDREELSAAIHARSPVAVIVPLPRIAWSGCSRMAALPRDGTATPEEALMAAAASWAVTPLADARDHLVHRSGIGRIIADGDGTIRFAVPR